MATRRKTKVEQCCNCLTTLRGPHIVCLEGNHGIYCLKPCWNSAIIHGQGMKCPQCRRPNFRIGIKLPAQGETLALSRSDPIWGEYYCGGREEEEEEENEEQYPDRVPPEFYEENATERQRRMNEQRLYEANQSKLSRNEKIVGGLLIVCVGLGILIGLKFVFVGRSFCYE